MRKKRLPRIPYEANNHSSLAASHQLFFTCMNQQPIMKHICVWICVLVVATAAYDVPDEPLRDARDFSDPRPDHLNHLKQRSPSCSDTRDPSSIAALLHEQNNLLRDMMENQQKIACYQIIVGVDAKCGPSFVQKSDRDFARCKALHAMCLVPLQYG